MYLPYICEMSGYHAANKEESGSQSMGSVTSTWF